MTNNKFSTGAFVFTRARDLQPRDPDGLQPLAHQHGLPGDIIISYARVRCARPPAPPGGGSEREGRRGFDASHDMPAAIR